jgi:hypothetical protein
MKTYMGIIGKKKSLDCTDVLGELACIVLSKILGTGSAERNWK